MAYRYPTDTPPDTQPAHVEAPGPLALDPCSRIGNIAAVRNMVEPAWWPSFRDELDRYVREECPPADSSLLAESLEPNLPSSGDEKLERGQKPGFQISVVARFLVSFVLASSSPGHIQTLTKHVRDVLVQALREGKLLEPFAKRCVGEKANARQIRLWKDKAVMAVFYRCSWEAGWHPIAAENLYAKRCIPRRKPLCKTMHPSQKTFMQNDASLAENLYAKRCIPRRKPLCKTMHPSQKTFMQNDASLAENHRVSMAPACQVRDAVTLVGRSLATRTLDEAARTVLALEASAAEAQEGAAVASEASSLRTPTKRSSAELADEGGGVGDADPKTPEKPTAKAKAAAGSGRKRELTQNLERLLCGHCHTEEDVHDVMHKLELRMRSHFPDLSFHNHLACLPQHALWFVQSLGLPPGLAHLAQCSLFFQ